MYFVVDDVSFLQCDFNELSTRLPIFVRRKASQLGLLNWDGRSIVLNLISNVRPVLCRFGDRKRRSPLMSFSSLPHRSQSFDPRSSSSLLSCLASSSSSSS